MAKPDPIILASIEGSINKELFVISFLLVISAVIPICAWYGFFQQDKDVSIWFQRSGSLTVLFAVWAEYKIFKVHTLTMPMSDGGETYQDAAHTGVLKTKYGNKLSVINFVSVTLVIIGTIIWGYGDLFRGA
ncbi:MAG: hypothetical protein KZQ97_18100 [Candidatus Thiodiazotropha sp. (ex Dulcina madagascariensis)]|nr:hypothetical protein [Candidatus Thiodiazotropha sp. (ex Dulcina madagascariensis)]